MEIFVMALSVALRVALLAVFVVALYALWSMLTDSASPLRLPLCLGCGSELQRVDVVHCSKCLGV